MTTGDHEERVTTAAPDEARDAPSAAPYSVVVPTIGRPCLDACLRALAEEAVPPPREIFLVDDRRDAGAPLDVTAAGALADRITVLVTGGRGPAAARNAGLSHVATPWAVFLDDDVQVCPGWGTLLAHDLAQAGPGIAGVQGRLTVPLPDDRRPTDWERCTAGLEDAAWATADMAYRTETVRRAGGFDERFPRAFREDADLALRLMSGGWTLARGTRSTLHPVRPADRWVSVRTQRGNADDALMNRLHGPDWWTRADAPRGRLPGHLAVTAAGLAAAVLALAGRRRAGAVAGTLWAAGTAQFAWARIAPGPRTAAEVATMLGTSVVIPPLAVLHRGLGGVRHRRAAAWGGTG
ncbi:Glycosyl transferase family 2 [Streptomyces sp. 2131.1]|uniref:glycosyltransferase family 2 protein n=1 Tax=Streptomyces sp. 2131.1 TaxID=1855346 RepID=UPI000894FD06|nr:glycosyltransferase [Streptomyces sp. 2131.1]SEB79436.1 Glycosyl transferase family 2 [Streptomyces sp. 2131.1]